MRLCRRRFSCSPPSHLGFLGDFRGVEDPVELHVPRVEAARPSVLGVRELDRVYAHVALLVAGPVVDRELEANALAGPSGGGASHQDPLAVGN